MRRNKMQVSRRNRAKWLLAAMMAATATLLPGRSFAQLSDNYARDREVRLSGRVSNVDRNSDTFDLERDRTQDLTIRVRNAEIYDSASSRRNLNLRDLRRGETVTVEGRWVNRDTVQATRVRLTRGLPDRFEDRYEDRYDDRY